MKNNELESSGSEQEQTRGISEGKLFDENVMFFDVANIVQNVLNCQSIFMDANNLLRSMFICVCCSNVYPNTIVFVFVVSLGFVVMVSRCLSLNFS
jgi:hypothetical protein